MIEKVKIIKLKKLFFIPDPGLFCRLPYPGHPKGCPMWGTREECPPYAPRIENKYDLEKECYFIVQPFNIAKQKEIMKRQHPGWSERQCGNLLYWQNSVRKELKKQVEIFLIDKFGIDLFSANNFRVGNELIPEAMGLHVFETALYNKISIERNPQKMIYKIAFVGVLK